jgi:outer membrane protein
MSRPFQPSLAKHACCAAAWLVLLSPVARAADVLRLAPESPDKPWVIPSSAETFKRLPPSMQGDEALGQGSRVPIEPDRRYSLAELIDIAQRNNPETRVAWEQARRAALAVGLDESEYAPQISIDVIGGYQRTPLPVPSSTIPAGYFVSDSREVFPVLALKWLLFDFGRREGQDRAARANSFVANVTFTGVHQKLAFTVSRAYFSLGAARGRLSAARRAVAAAETLQDAAVSRRERGVATVVVSAQAQRQTAQARFYLAKATGDERTAYANLIASLGVAADARIDIVDSSQHSLPAEPPQDLDALLRDALMHRPDVVAAIGKIDAAEGALASRRADYYPKIGLSAQLYQNIGGLSTDGGPWANINQTGGSILLTLSIPLFDGGGRDTRVASAKSEVAAARDNLAQVRDAATLQVVSAYNDLKTALAAYSAAVALRGAAQTAYDAALGAFDSGVGTYTDVASELSSVAMADAQAEDAHANVFTAAAALAFATGTVQRK